MELTDGVISLRHPDEGDATDVTSAVRTSLPELMQWMPWAKAGFDSSHALSWIRGETDPGAEPFVVVDTDGALIGTAGLHPFIEKDLRIELGYWIRTDRTGRGLASRATRLLARYAIEQRGARRVEIVMSVENEGSRRVAENAGAVHEGIARNRILLHGVSHDAHVYSLIPTDLPDVGD